MSRAKAKIDPLAVKRVLSSGAKTSQEVALALGLDSAMQVTARLKSLERSGEAARGDDGMWRLGRNVVAETTYGTAPAPGRSEVLALTAPAQAVQTKRVKRLQDLKGWKLRYVWLKDRRVDVVTDPDTGTMYVVVNPDSNCEIVVEWDSGIRTGLRVLNRSWSTGRHVLNNLESDGN